MKSLPTEAKPVTIKPSELSVQDSISRSYTFHVYFPYHSRLGAIDMNQLSKSPISTRHLIMRDKHLATEVCHLVVCICISVR